MDTAHPTASTTESDILGLFDGELASMAGSLELLRRRLKNHRDDFDADTFGRVSEGLACMTTGLFEMTCRGQACTRLATRTDDDADHYCPACWPYELEPCAICSYPLRKGQGIAAADHEGIRRGRTGPPWLLSLRRGGGITP